MDEKERRIRQRLKDDFPHYASKCLKIRTKSGTIEPFIFNKAQLYLHNQVEQQKRETGKIRAIIVKGRQEGISTYIEGRFFWRVTHTFGLQAFILTHALDATQNLFKMAQRYYDNCPKVVKPELTTSNAKELIFGGLDCGYKIGTAENKAVGRSSTIQLFHGSEVAFWQNASDHAKGIMQAIPNEKNSEVFLESTANGVGNYFHEQWQMAEAGFSEFLPIFIPWFWMDEYIRDTPMDFRVQDDELQLVEQYGLIQSQLMWRRLKIIELSVGGIDGTKAFKQEYPNNSIEAFQISGEDNFILADVVNKARKSIAEPYGPLIVGVDPARYGDDRTSIIRRRGRCAYKLESYIKKDTMEIAGFVHRIIIEEGPDKVAIDVGGLGAGVFDRCKELGHGDICVAVNGGATPLDQKRYYNKRAEMWGEMKEWLLDFPSQIPDNDSLHADLCNIKYKFDSKTRLLMEKKEDMKKRGIRSPDEGDALALTFALPDLAMLEQKKKTYANIGKKLVGTFNHIDRLKKEAYR